MPGSRTMAGCSLWFIVAGMLPTEENSLCSEIMALSLRASRTLSSVSQQKRNKAQHWNIFLEQVGCQLCVVEISPGRDWDNLELGKPRSLGDVSKLFSRSPFRDEHLWSTLRIKNYQKSELLRRKGTVAPALSFWMHSLQRQAGKKLKVSYLALVEEVFQLQRCLEQFLEWDWTVGVFWQSEINVYSCSQHGSPSRLSPGMVSAKCCAQICLSPPRSPPGASRCPMN